MKSITPLSRLIQLLSFIFLLLAAPISHAQLIEADAFESGDNKAFTLDFARYTLIWMDASELLNLDRNEVQQLLDDGLAEQGWRFPSLSESERIFNFMYVNNYDSAPYTEVPYICIPEVFCTFVNTESEDGLLWPTFQSTIGLNEVSDEYFSHTFFIPTRKVEYLAFDLILNIFEPAFDDPDYPEWHYDEFYYHEFSYTIPPFIDEDYYAPIIDDYPNPFSFLLVKDVPTSRNNDDVPIPEPTSSLLLMLISLTLVWKTKRQ